MNRFVTLEDATNAVDFLYAEIGAQKHENSLAHKLIDEMTEERSELLDATAAMRAEIERLRAEHNQLKDAYSIMSDQLLALRAELNDRNEQLLAVQAVNRMLVKQQHAMLAACKECVAVAERGGQDDDWRSIELCRAAIKLAEGE